MENKIFALLGNCENGLDESQIIDILGISHGTFFTAIRVLINMDLVQFVRVNRRKIYSLTPKGYNKIQAQKEALEEFEQNNKPPNFGLARSGKMSGNENQKPRILGISEKDKKEKKEKEKKKEIENRYDSDFSGIFRSFDDFMSIVSDETNSDWVDIDTEKNRLLALIDDNIVRWDYTELADNQGILVRRFKPFG